MLRTIKIGISLGNRKNEHDLPTTLRLTRVNEKAVFVSRPSLKREVQTVKGKERLALPISGKVEEKILFALNEQE